MDGIDIKILRILGKNCRESYEDIAKKIDVTSNTVRRRIEKLEQNGVIEKFVILPSFAMVNAEFAVIFIDSKEYRFDDTIMENIISHPGVLSVGYDNSGSYVIRAEYSGSRGLLEMRSYFESLRGTNKVLIHTIPVNPGSIKEFSEQQLCVIKALRMNPRMSHQGIAKATGLSLKRVRRLLDEIITSNAITLTTEVNLQSSKNTIVVLRMKWDPRKANLDDITNWMESKFSESLYNLSFSAHESVVFAFIILSSLNETIPIVESISVNEALKLESMGAVFTIKRAPGLREMHLDKMLENI
ncbi:MAG: winged helix-turn-helix transcriptional regulator [Candidatus Thorarchaeota archaeon]